MLYQRKVLPLVMMAMLVPAPLAAQEPVPGSQPQVAVPQVLTPARLRQPRSEVPASVTVIDRDLIRASGAREIWELFRLVPGMSAERTGGNVPAVSYHGTQARNTRRMQVLSDGRTQQRPGLARVVWNDIPLSIEDIERIEVTRGPNSAMYGANAMTGVINIITRHPRDLSGMELERRTGNNGVRDGRGTVATASGHGALRVTVERRADHGYGGPEDEDEHFPDARWVESLNLRGSYELSPRDELEFMGGASRSLLERPFSSDLNAFAEPRAPHQESRGSEQFAQLRWERLLSPAHQLQVQLYGQQSTNERRAPLCARDPLTGEPGPGAGLLFSRELRDLYEDSGRDLEATLATMEAELQDPDSPLRQRYDELDDPALPDFCGDLLVDVQEQRLDLEVQSTRHFGDLARLVSGVNLRHDSAESLAYASGRASSSSRRAFANLELRPGDPLRFNLGGYYEHHDNNDSFFSPRAAVIMMPAPGHGVRLVWSEAVRALDLMETDGETTVRLRNIPPEYQSDPEGLFGWEHPDFFVTQSIPGDLKPERIKSRELGYYGRMGPVELDLRFYHESLRDLVVSSMSLFDLEADNDSRVEHQGWEAEAGWHVTPRQYLHGTLMRNRLENQRNAEGRFGPEESSSLLYQYQPGRDWLLSASWYRARDYNEFRYERIGAHVSRRYALANTELVLRGTLEHDLADTPVVFERNRAEERNRYWLSAALRFR